MSMVTRNMEKGTFYFSLHQATAATPPREKAECPFFLERLSPHENHSLV